MRNIVGCCHQDQMGHLSKVLEYCSAEGNVDSGVLTQEVSVWTSISIQARDHSSDILAKIVTVF